MHPASKLRKTKQAGFFPGVLQEQEAVAFPRARRLQVQQLGHVEVEGSREWAENLLCVFVLCFAKLASSPVAKHLGFHCRPHLSGLEFNQTPPSGPQFPLQSFGL